MLVVEALHTHYGKSHVLQGVTLNAGPGEVVAILGRNGVGKTTLVRSIMNLVRPSSGRVRVAGHDVTRWSPHRIARLGVGLVPQGREVFPSLSVEENLRIATRSGGDRQGSWTMERVLSLFPNLRERLRNRAYQLSGGEQQMLAIGRALLTNPALLLMDEPSEGLAPSIVRQLASTIRELRASGLCVLLVEQNLKLALEVADRVYLMSRGQMVYEGTPASLERSHQLLERYLGVGAMDSA